MCTWFRCCSASFLSASEGLNVACKKYRTRCGSMVVSNNKYMNRIFWEKECFYQIRYTELHTTKFDHLPPDFCRASSKIPSYHSLLLKTSHLSTWASASSAWTSGPSSFFIFSGRRAGSSVVWRTRASPVSIRRVTVVGRRWPSIISRIRRIIPTSVVA